MNEIDIFRALQNAVKAAVATSEMPSLPIAFVDVAFTKPNDQKWLEVIIIPNTNSEYWGDEIDYRGMFRLILHWPKSGEGLYTPLRVLGSISSYFTQGKLLSGVQIYASPSFTGSVDGAGDILYPVSMRYTSFKGV